MVDKGLTYTGILVAILVMAGMWAGFSEVFNDMNANPSYSVNVNETTLRFFNNSQSIKETGETVKRQVNESSSRWSDTLGLIFEGIPNFISTLTGAFSVLTTMLGSMGSVFGIPTWFIGIIGTIITIVGIGLFLRTISNRGTI